MVRARESVLAGGSGLRWRPCRALVLAAVVLSLALAGCRGCRPAPEDPEEARRKRQQAEKERLEREKPPLELKSVVALPAPPKGLGLWYKPGHWTLIGMTATANHADLAGQWELAPVDEDGQTLGLTATAFAMAGSRSFAISKDQTKELESAVFLPPAARSARLSCLIGVRHGIGGQYSLVQPLKCMPSFQYFLVVLARRPDGYAPWTKLRAMQPPVQRALLTREPYYRIVRFGGDKRPALPSQALMWTSIAAMVWDDVAPATLDTNQQQALLDWLHWGGQLIVSGPDTLDALRGSFLAPYLPATSSGSMEIGADGVAELDKRWTPEAGSRRLPGLLLVHPWSGIRLQKHPQAQFLRDTGGLFVERRVGRGRIVVSAFHLTTREFTAWPGCDATVNACLLRRPARAFSRSREVEGLLLANDLDDDWSMQWLGDGEGSHSLDPHQISHVRYFTRDAGVGFDLVAADVHAEETRHAALAGNGGFGGGSEPGDEEPAQGTGVAAWNDFSPVAGAARQALTTAARIEIPNRSFVVYVVAGYLILLVPVNWLLFRTLGRVEWAWVAAPVIAVACSLVVINLAHLEIGFVRSQTELAVVEAQPGYARAHVTRYSAVYSSLSTTYQMTLEKDPGAAAQPFPTVRRPEAFRFLPGQGRTLLHQLREDDTRLTGLGVSSSTTSLLHSEQLADLGGPLTLRDDPAGSSLLTNHSRQTISEAGVIRKLSDGELEAAWIGTLRPGAAATLNFNTAVPQDGGSVWAERRRAAPPTSGPTSTGELDLGPLVNLAGSGAGLEPGETRLVGWLSEALPGQVIEPQAAQRQSITLLVAHLAFGPGRDPQPDRYTVDALPGGK